MQAEFEIEVQWRAFPLHPDTPDEGLSLAAYFAGRGIDPAQARVRVAKAAAEAGLPLGKHQMTYNTRLAQELAKWAEGKGAGDAFHHAVFRAYFADDLNIGSPQTLLTLVKALGLPEAEAAAALQQRTFRQAVDADWALCQRLGIEAVQTFVVEGRAVVGAQPYDVLANLLRESGIRRK